MTDCVFCPDNWDNLDVVQRLDDTNSMGSAAAIINPLDPVTEGHVLVIWGKHTSDVGDDPWVAGMLMQIAATYVANQGTDANIITSVGPYATQTVWHTHVHIVPRRPNDGLPLPWTPQHEAKASEALSGALSDQAIVAATLPERQRVDSLRAIKADKLHQELVSMAVELGVFPIAQAQSLSNEQLQDGINAERAATHWLNKLEGLSSDAAKRAAVKRLRQQLVPDYDDQGTYVDYDDGHAGGYPHHHPTERA